MTEWLPEDLSTFILFLWAALVVLIVPGPAILYITGISLDRGVAAGLVSVLGIAVGAFAQLVLIVFGVALVAGQIPWVLPALAYLGAAYLFYLGIERLRAPGPSGASAGREDRPLGRIFRDGVVVSLLNPKTGLFLLAFLPQFVDPALGPAGRQVFLLGTIFIAMGIVTDGAYACAAGSIHRTFRKHPGFARAQKYVGGGIFILLSVFLVAAEAGRSF